MLEGSVVAALFLKILDSVPLSLQGSVLEIQKFFQTGSNYFQIVTQAVPSSVNNTLVNGGIMTDGLINTYSIPIILRIVIAEVIAPSGNFILEIEILCYYTLK